MYICTYIRTCVYLFVQNLNSALHLATKYNHTEVVEILGKAGADVNIC